MYNESAKPKLSCGCWFVTQWWVPFFAKKTSKVHHGTYIPDLTNHIQFLVSHKSRYEYQTNGRASGTRESSKLFEVKFNLIRCVTGCLRWLKCVMTCIYSFYLYKHEFNITLRPFLKKINRMMFNTWTFKLFSCLFVFFIRRNFKFNNSGTNLRDRKIHLRNMNEKSVNFKLKTTHSSLAIFIRRHSKTNSSFIISWYTQTELLHARVTHTHLNFDRKWHMWSAYAQTHTTPKIEFIAHNFWACVSHGILDLISMYVLYTCSKAWLLLQMCVCVAYIFIRPNVICVFN